MRLRATNYRTFPTLDLHLPTGCVGITGLNGAGKSSIVSAIDTALFGPDTRSLEPYLAEGSVPGDSLALTLELEHRGEHYRIRRGYTMQNGGRGKTTCDFERDAAPSLGPDAASLWEPLTQGDLKDTQAMIERTFGLTRETFRASAMLAQGDGGSFTEAQPRDRKRILADALGLAFWDECKTLAGRDRRDRETQCEALVGRVQLLDEQLAGTDTLAVDVEALADLARGAEHAVSEGLSLVAAAKAEHEQLAARAQAAAAARAALNTAKAEHAALERERVSAAQAAEQARELEQSLPHLRARADELDTLKREREELTAARHEQQLREQQRAALTVELEQVTASQRRSEQAAEQTAERHRAALTRIEELLNHRATRCDRCEQELPDGARGRALASNQREADDLAAQHQRHTLDHVELGERVETLRAQLAGIEPSLPDNGRFNVVAARCSELARAREDLATAAERIAGLTATATLRTTFADELAAAERKVADATLEQVDAPDDQTVTDARRRLADAETARTIASQRAETAKVDLATARAGLQIVEKARAERDQAVAERDRLQGELDELQLLERAFGRDGVPTWILETSAIPALEVEADRLLGLLGTDYRVELRTERELKSGGAAETLDVILVTPSGERDYSSFSGGERTRLNLALRLALARLLAHRRGAESRLLAIDEPEFLDAAGTERLVDALRDLHGSGDFDRVLLVSHHAALRDAFDTTLSVVKTDGRSEVTVG